MLFNSFEFLIFFPFVVGVYYLLPHRFRWFFLLLASYYFYMCWKAEYCILIGVSTLSVYLVARLMSDEEDKQKRKILLSAGIVFNLFMLFVFKYYNFFNDSVRSICNSLNIFYNVPTFRLLLPVGISFYTFQAIGYIVDVYRRGIKAEKHLGIFALFISFFPQLLAGPIGRAASLLPQLSEKHSFDLRRVQDGLTLMLWGFFKKMVIADNLSVVVAEVYGNPPAYPGLPSFIATVFLAFQVYCDFSGYSDIAIGAAKVLGIRLMTNFDRPFAAHSMSEFWRRWHISLTTWFRDYLYIPLGGNRKGQWRHYTNIMIVFLLMGLWHGAGWNFVVYGIIYGIASSCDVFIKKLKIQLHSPISRKISGVLSIAGVFAIVSIAMLFFRVNNLADAICMVKNIGSWNLTIPVVFKKHSNQLYAAVLGILIMEVVQFLMTKKVFWQERICTGPRWVRWPAYYALIIAIGFFADVSEQPFVYFQF